jgi:voltage-gated potassium channel
VSSPTEGFAVGVELDAVEERARRWERRFEVPVLVAAVLVIPVIVIEQSSPGEPWKAIAAITNWAIWMVFAVEYVTMLSVVPSRRRWLRDHLLETAIVLLTPPFLPASLQALRAFRLLRLVRILRLAKIARRLFSPEGIRDASVLAAVTALGGGAAFAAAENRSTWDGVYWSITTMTTVGYGDLSPHTDMGRVIAICVMVLGIGFLSIVIGAVAHRFIARDVAEIEREIGDDVDVTEQVARDLKEITARLRAVEASVARLAPRR